MRDGSRGVSRQMPHFLDLTIFRNLLRLCLFFSFLVSPGASLGAALGAVLGAALGAAGWTGAEPWGS